MKAFASVLFFICCVTTFGNAYYSSGDDDDILSEKGTFNAAHVVTTWRHFLEEEKSCTDEQGLPLVQELIDYINPISEVFNANDLKGAAQMFDECNAIARRLLPHIKCDETRQIHSKQIDNCQKLIDILIQADDSAELNTFLRNTYMHLFSKSKSILTAIGSYKPGSIFTWNAWLRKIEENVDQSGKNILKKWTRLMVPWDAALSRGNMKRAMEILQEALPIIRNLLPHIHHKKLHGAVSNIAMEIEILIKSKLDLKNLDGFHRKSSGAIN